MRPFQIFYSTFLFLLLGCGAQPGDPKPDPAPAPDPNLSTYRYMDATGSAYDVTQQKLIFTPASEDDTVDGTVDDGYYTELNITRNDYAKIAAAFEEQLGRSQGSATNRDPALPVPHLSRSGGNKDALETDLDAKAVQGLNHLLEPYINDQQ